MPARRAVSSMTSSLSRLPARNASASAARTGAEAMAPSTIRAEVHSPPPSTSTATATPRMGKSIVPRRRTLRYVALTPLAAGTTISVRISSGARVRYSIPSSR